MRPALRHGLLLLVTAGLSAAALPADTVTGFNSRLEDATRRMDSEALAALWDDGGISLLPDTPPLIGKRAIAAFTGKVMSQLVGARMTSFTLHCAGIVQTGALATEWCDEHQLVDLGSGKTFDGRGRLLLVLRRGGDGRWRLLREMFGSVEPAATGSR